jgi:hypothetical protein
VDVEFESDEDPEDVTLLTDTLENCEPEPQSITIVDSVIMEEATDAAATVAADDACNDAWLRFFGDALPRLMLAVTFEGCTIAPRLLRTFARACSSPPLVLSHRTRTRLRNVIMREIEFDAAQLDALSQIVRPHPDELGILALHFDQCKFPEGKCDVIWDRLHKNRHLRCLMFTLNNLKEFGPRELDVVNSTWLRRLVVAEPGLVDAEQSQLDTAHALRHNERLISVAVFGNMTTTKKKKASRAVTVAFGDLVQWFNWKLDRVQLENNFSHWLGPDCPTAARNSHLGRWLRSNVRVRTAQEQLHERNYAVSPVSLVPTALEVVGPKPTLIFRLLRRENLPAFCDAVVAVAVAAAHAPPSSQRGVSEGVGRVRRQRHAATLAAPPPETKRPARKRRR